MLRRILVVTLAVAAIAAGCASTPETEVPTGIHLQGSFAVPASLNVAGGIGDELRYLVWLPEGYGQDADGEWPFIVFLHGSGDDDYDSGWVMSYGLTAMLYLEEEPDNFDFVVVAPQAAPGTAWWDGNQLDVIGALIEDAIDTYLIDPDRVYLTGLSMGGYGSWFLATRYPDRFAAMVSISGSGYRTRELPPPETTCRLTAMPIWAIHGANDSIADAAAITSIVDAYQELCDDPIEWTLYPDEGHFGAYERAYRDPALYDWLLDQSR
jgi:predicted peptidase